MSGAQPASAGSANGQLALTELWLCTTCGGSGRVPDLNHWSAEVTDRCPTCKGAGTLDYDPTDLSLVGF